MAKPWGAQDATRKFDGKVYHLYQRKSHKSDADMWARRLRQEGGLARVVKVGNMYEIYIRNR